MAHAQGSEAPVEHGLGFVDAAGIVRAAEIVDVVVAIAAEVGPFARTPGKRTVVINDYLAARGAEGTVPVVVELVFEAPAQVQRVVLHGLGPGLPGQVILGVDAMGQLVAAKQLIAGYRILLAVLVLGIQLQDGIRVDLPVKRHGGEVALAVGMIDIGTNVLVGEVDPQAQLALGAEPAAQVGGQVALALFVARHVYAAHILRALGHVVDQPAGL